MDKVVITKSMVGICGMQVCAHQDAQDGEILEICNTKNPSGTKNGWVKVLRNIDPNSMFETENAMPVQCADDPERKHFIVLC